MQPRDAGAGAGGEGAVMTREEKIKAKLDEILEKLPEEFPVRELYAKAEEKTPYTVVALQECERMNLLTREMRRSLKELNLGLKGELTITADMEQLQDALFFEQVPAAWTKRAYPSMYSLGLWYSDLLLRIKELEIWTGDFQLPAAVWLGGLFNPQSFLTAIMQTTARKNEWPLDKMCLSVDVTKKTREELGGAPREGAYVHGLYMEGARWDTQTGQLSEARLKELTPMMPVCFVKAIPGKAACPIASTHLQCLPFSLQSIDVKRRISMNVQFTRRNNAVRLSFGHSTYEQKRNQPNGFWAVCVSY